MRSRREKRFAAPDVYSVHYSHEPGDRIGQYRMVRMRDLDVQKGPSTPGVYSVRQAQKPGDRKGGEWMVRIDCFLKISIN